MRDGAPFRRALLEYRGPVMSARPNVIGEGFVAQTWDGESLVSEVVGLSYDAAKEVAWAATLTGHVGRIMGERIDWCEVFTSEGYRAGTFAETTLVREV